MGGPCQSSALTGTSELESLIRAHHVKLLGEHPWCNVWVGPILASGAVRLE